MLAQRLRGPGFPGADLDQARRSVKGQLRQAARQGARMAVFVGREDLAADVVRVRDLRSGAEEDVPADRVAERILELLSGETVSEG
jgi:histidyl-tRNA synthetase